jgi:SAM-dependent methyltransferase
MQMAMDHDDVGEGRSCLDLGCGTGMLLVAASLVGTDYVMGVDCDEEALQVAQENLEHIELEDSVGLMLARVLMKGGEGVKDSSKRKQHEKRDREKGRGGPRGRGRGGRGSQPSLSTKAALILDSADGIPLQDKCVE